MTYERSFGQVLQEIGSNIQDLVRSEIRLAGAEFREEGTKAVKAGKEVAIGGVLALYAGGLLLLTLVYLLTLVVPAWAAAAIVFAITALPAAILLMTGVQHWRTVHPKPEKTVATVKENIEWAKHHARSNSTYTSRA
jgi:uncharacterized membrane protein YqjE